MHVELSCGGCGCRFVAPPEAPTSEVMERMGDEGPWFSLGDGETFEDMIFAALTEEGQITCPECDRPASVCEESLGRLAMEVLARW